MGSKAKLQRVESLRRQGKPYGLRFNQVEGRESTVRVYGPTVENETRLAFTGPGDVVARPKRPRLFEAPLSAVEDWFKGYVMGARAGRDGVWWPVEHPPADREGEWTRDEHERRDELDLEARP